MSLQNVRIYHYYRVNREIDEISMWMIFHLHIILPSYQKNRYWYASLTRCRLHETRLRTNGNRDNGGLSENWEDDEKATNHRNETRLEYSSRFCAAILTDHLSLAPWPPLKAERRSSLDEIALDPVPWLSRFAIQPRFGHSATNGTFFNILDKRTSPSKQQTASSLIDDKHDRKKLIGNGRHPSWVN